MTHDDVESSSRRRVHMQDRRDVVVHPIVLLGVVDHYNRVA